MQQSDEFVLNERWRPPTVEDCILPKRIKDVVLSFKKEGNLQSMVFNGPPGAGKTSLARALCKDLDIDYFYVNGSNEGRSIDLIRTEIETFVTTCSNAKNNKVKVVIIDEADNMSKDAQNALKAFMETHSATARFIFTTNSKHKLLDALLSRCDVIDFFYTEAEKDQVCFEFCQRVLMICEKEGIEVTEGGKKAVVQLITMKAPDFRKIFAILHSAFIKDKKITEDILVLIKDSDFEKLMKDIAGNEFGGVKEFTIANADNFEYIIEALYQNGLTWFTPMGYANAILILAKYQHTHEIVANKEVNLTAMFVEMKTTCEFKS